MMLFIGVLSFCLWQLVQTAHPDENLSITQMIRRHNYTAESHYITTADGYILKVFRIPHGRDPESTQNPKKVVLVVHGLASSSDDWVTLGDDALPYFLADNNFDVWLFNARGTRHSRRHKTLDPDLDSSKFWNFSWDEIGMYDLPATIDYILQKSGAERIYYVGHSQGGTSFLVMLSEKPEFNDKIVVASLLAPAAYFEEIKNSTLLKIVTILYSPFARNVNFYEFPPKTIFYTNNMAKELCSFPGLIIFCYNAIYFGVQLKDHPIDQSLVPIIAQHAPSTFSTKQIHHYTQIMESGEFKKFNYGPKMNERKYGSKKAPFYNLSAVTVPIRMFYGTGDILASPKSVLRIGKELPNSKHEVQKVPFEGFDHIDFLWARNARTLLFEKTLEYFKNFFAAK